MTRLRKRIYDAYLDGGPAAVHLESEGDLVRRSATMNSLISRHFPDDLGAQILDVGCGYGALLYFARKRGYANLQGVDISPQQVALAQRLGISGVSQGDLLETLRAQPPGTVDVVVAFDVIEHFTKDELIDLVDAIAKALKPGGRWLIQAPNGESPFCGAIRYGDMTHEQAFTRSSLEQLLIASGFSAVAVHETPPVVHGIKSAVRWVLWQLIRLGLRIWSLAETGDSGRKTVFTRNLLAVATRGD